MCYEYTSLGILDSWEKFNENHYCRKKSFYNKEISDQIYRHAQNMEFITEDLGEYVISAYNMTSTVQLLGFVANFTKNVHRKFNLNPLNFAMKTLLHCLSLLFHILLKSHPSLLFLFLFLLIRFNKTKYFL